MGGAVNRPPVDRYDTWNSIPDDWPGNIAIRESLREPVFQNGVWVYLNRADYCAVPVIQTTSTANELLVQHVELYGDRDIVCLYRETVEGLRVQGPSVRPYTLENEDHVKVIFQDVVSFARIGEDKRARLLSELSAIGELERTLRREMGSYRLRR